MEQICRLSFRPNKLYREYGSNIYFKTKKGVDRIQFRTSIIYAGSFDNKTHIFHLYKHDILINKTKPDDHIDRLAHACNSIFYPLIIFCNSYGQVIDIRHDVIWDRWQEKYYSINREFRGDVADKYIKTTNANLRDPRNRSKLLSKDYFFKTYFSLDYKLLPTGEKEKTYPLIPFEKNVECKTVQRSFKPISDNTIIVEQKGVVDDHNLFDYNKICNEYGREKNGKINGETIVSYTLGDGLIDSIKSRFILRKENGELLIKVVMQSYYLEDYKISPILDKESIRYAKDRHNENKQSLWERFNNYLNKPL